jgi:hypothetical protein
MSTTPLTTGERITQAIHIVRGHKVMLDADLAALYGVVTKALNQAVKRNLARFPEDFMFQLTREEAEALRSQSVTLDAPTADAGAATSRRGKHLKYSPYAFTEQGVAMLSSVLHSERAVLVNIEIMRAFVRLRAYLAAHEELQTKLAKLERKYDAQFRAVFDAIRQLMEPPVAAKRQIGFGAK